MSFIGLWLDRISGDSLGELQEYDPEWLTIGSGTRNDTPTFFALLRNLKGASFRETSGPGAKVRGFMGPQQLANSQADFFDGLVSAGILTQGRAKEICYGHGPDEEHQDFEWAIEFEEQWLVQLHQRGYKGIGWNCSFGWDYHRLTQAQKVRLQAHWNNLDLIGRHSYLGFLFNAIPPRGAKLDDTIFAMLNWEGLPREKVLCTEGGYDFWSTGAGDPGYQGLGSPGWKATGLSEQHVISAIKSAVGLLDSLGFAGYTWYAHRCQNDSEWENFYMTATMRREFKNFGRLRLPQGEKKMPEYRLGFKELAEKLGADVVGDPLTDEYQADLGGRSYNIQQTSNGEMRYTGGIQSYFLAGKR